MEKVKEPIKRLIFWIYPKIFGEEPGPVVLNFIKNLGYVGIGFTFAKLFSLFFQIGTGRTLGSHEYGKFVLVFSISSFLYIPMLIGISAALVKYLAEENNEEEKRNILSTGILLILISTVLFSFIFYMFSNKIALISSVSQRYIFAAILMAIFNVLFILSKKVTQGLFEMKKVSVIEVTWAIVSIITLAILLTSITDARAPITALVVGYGISSLIVLPNLKKHFRLTFNKKWVKILLSYGSYTILAGVSSVIVGNIDRIFINKFLGITEVGLYQAYFFSTLGISGFLTTIFNTVFFPEASRGDKKVILEKIKKILRLFPLLFPIVLLGSFIILILYGEEYEFILPLIAVFASASLMASAYSIYTTYIASFGVHGVRIYLYSILAASMVNASLNFVLIPRIHLYGGPTSMIAGYLTGIALTLILTKKKRFIEVGE